MKRKRESDLYKPVARFLQRQYGCKVTWIAGSGTDLAFAAGFGKRKLDVVACKLGPLEGEGEVHLAEAKLLNLPTHGFEETKNQLDSFRRYADYLWAVFPAERWSSAVANHDHWTSELREKGYGLLLVDEGRVELKSSAQRNSDVDQKAKKSVLDALLKEEPDEPMRIPTLASETAETAMRAAARVFEIMSGPVREGIGKTRRKSTFPDSYGESDTPFFVIGGAGDGKCYIQGDPFSTYLKDGRALIWVWRVLGRLRDDEKRVLTITSRPHPTDVYFYSDNGKGEWICRPLSELSVEGLKAAGYLGGFELGRAVPISNRSKKGIAADIRRLVAWTRELA